MQEESLSPETILNLDNQAKELGMGGKLSQERDESSYKKRRLQKIKRKKLMQKKLLH